MTMHSNHKLHVKGQMSYQMLNDIVKCNILSAVSIPCEFPHRDLSITATHTDKACTGVVASTARQRLLIHQSARGGVPSRGWGCCRSWSDATKH